MNPRKAGILLVAYGSGTLEAQRAFNLFRVKVAERFSCFPMRWAFTSENMRSKLALSGKKSDSVVKAIKRMTYEKYTHLYIQSLHLVQGIEYNDFLDDIHQALQNIEIEVRVACPLIEDLSSFPEISQALFEYLPKPKFFEATLCMAHGTLKTKEPLADALYAELAHYVHTANAQYYIACMKGSVLLEHIIPQMQAEGIKKVHLVPLLSLIGGHARDDMAGSGPFSWKSRLEQAGFECQPYLNSLAQSPLFVDLWLNRLQDVIGH